MNHTDEAGRIRRSLELLWRVKPAPRGGRQVSVSATKVVSTGVRMADRDGLEAVSMRRIAERVGVTAMAIYSHTPTKAILVDAMLDHVLAELTRNDPPAGTWREQLTWSAHQARALYQKHPWTLSVTTVRRPFGPNLLAALESDLRIVSGLGLEAEEMVNIVDTVDNYVHGALAADLANSRAATSSTLSNQEWFRLHGDFLSQLKASQRYPLLASFWETGQVTAHRVDFDFGLNRVLDGIEYHLSKRNIAMAATGGRRAAEAP